MALRILLPVKRVIDYSVQVRIRPDKRGVELENVKMSMNPFDEIAVEEALRLKEKNFASELIAVSIGPKKVQDTIRSALAVGVDRGIHIETNENEEIQPLDVAKILAKLAAKENADVLILGKQAIDDDCNQTGQLLAGLLNWPQATFASKVEYNDQSKSFNVTREIDGGLETIEVKTPAVITADLRLNTPRYAGINGIRKAKSKTIDVLSTADLGITLSPRIQTLSVESPPKREAGVKVKDVIELATMLEKEGFVN